MSGRVILNLSEELVQRIDNEKDRRGATRNGIITRILEGYFIEQQEMSELYNEWFMAEVSKGIKSAREEPLVDHEDVVKQVRELIAGTREKNADKVV